MYKNIFLLFIIVPLLTVAAQSHALDDINDTDGSTLQFIVIGDWGTPRSKGQKLVAGQMNKLAASTAIDFIISTGDNFYSKGVKTADDPLWQSSFENIYALPALKNIPWYITLGNHDYKGNIYAQIEYGHDHPNWILPQTYHSKEFRINKHASALFLFLDTNSLRSEYRARPWRYQHIEEQDADVQIAWMKKTLSESEATWRIAIGHHPVFSAGRHGDTESFKAVLPQIFERYNVQGYFAGHDHHLEHYYRSGATHYFISGAGSRPRSVSKGKTSPFAVKSLGFAHVVLDESCMLVRFINEQGSELYRSRIAAEGGGDCRQSSPAVN